MKTITNPEVRQRLKRKYKKARYEPLYGLEILHLLAKEDGYKLVSFCENSIPTPGSQTFAIEKANPKHNFKVERVIIHKDLNITIKTKDKGFVKYLK